MNQNYKAVFNNSRVTIVMYYTYLHLGYFYAQLSKRENLSGKTFNMELLFETDKYLLRHGIIKSSLEDIYNKPNSIDVFSHLILNNSTRGIAMALFEALNDKEIEKLFLEHIFTGDKESYDNFSGIVRFIRNTFSHNIRDRMELKMDDYIGQISYLRGKGKSGINFCFDYAKSSIPIDRKNYTVEIDIDFNQIRDGVLYTDIISAYKTLLFIELCYNCMQYLESVKSKDIILN